MISMLNANSRRFISLALLGIFFCFTEVGAQENQGAVLPLPLEEVRIFTEALDRIRMSYVEEVDDKTLLENAI